MTRVFAASPLRLIKCSSVANVNSSIYLFIVDSGVTVHVNERLNAEYVMQTRQIIANS